ncbi:MAG: hypothetical protein ONA69_03545 [candidate division KSB1 bacterium]|nr:hypothetical protein [candidate division KSB1 bacterium]
MKQKYTEELKASILDWLKYPNALGSEAHAGDLVYRVSEMTGRKVPEKVREALRILSLRSTLRDLFSEIMRREDKLYRSGMPPLPQLSFHDLTDGVLACSGISQAEAVGIISAYLRRWISKYDKKR